MKKLVLASIAAATLIVGATVTQPAHAQACWSGPLGIMHGCTYGPGPGYAYGPGYPGPYYAPPPYPYYGPYDRW